MEIAKLNERITIQKTKVSVDNVGNHMNTWEDYYSCHAYAAATIFKEGEVETAGVVVSDETLTFTIRWCSEVSVLTSTGYRVMFHGEPYNITSIDSMNFTHKSMKLRCTKEHRK